MLHQPAKTFVAAPPAPPLPYSPDDIKRAKTCIAIARKCGLVVAPWLSYPAGDRAAAEGGVLLTGQDETGRNDFSVANHRFAFHPANAIYRSLPTALIFDVLCADFGVDPADPDLCAKVNVRLKAEDDERQRVAAESNLLALCKRADPLLRECERLELTLSDLDDSFTNVEKPTPPNFGPFPHTYHSLSYAELKAKMVEEQQRPAETANQYFLGLIATGAFPRLLREKKAYDAQMHALQAAHGLTAAEKAANASTARVRAIITEIAALPATTARALAAKCRVMNLCRQTGWAGFSIDDEFKDLTFSIIDDGARLGDLPDASRPPRSGTVQHAHH